MPDCRWCNKPATRWVHDDSDTPPRYPVCDWHADECRRLGWGVVQPEFPEPCENCGKVWENGDCFTTPARTVRCALIRTAKDAPLAAPTPEAT